jgi:hypothetical protein
MIQGRDRVGSGLLRKLYGDFLKQCAVLVDDDEFELHGREYITLGELWDDTADMLRETGEYGDFSRIDAVNENLAQVYRKEEALIRRLSVLVRE